MYVAKPKTIIPHHLLQRMRSYFRFILHNIHYMREVNEIAILEKKKQFKKADAHLYLLRNIYDKRIKKLSQVQTRIKRVEGGSDVFTHSDLQRIEKLLTTLTFLRGMPEIQHWVRKQKYFSGK